MQECVWWFLVDNVDVKPKERKKEVERGSENEYLFPPFSPFCYLILCSLPTITRDKQQIGRQKQHAFP